MNKSALTRWAFGVLLVGYWTTLIPPQLPPENSGDASPDTTRIEHADWQQITERGTLKVLTRYSSVSYFLHHGMDRGFEYELLYRFARKHDLNLETIILKPDQDPVELLQNGAADILAANLIISPDLSGHISFTNPYDLVDLVVAVPEQTAAHNLNYVFGKQISTTHTLASATDFTDRYGNYMNLSLKADSAGWDSEMLLHSVAEGEIDGAIVESHVLKAAANYIPGIKKGPTIATQLPVAWATHREAGELNDKLNQFIARHFYINYRDGSIQRSTTMNVLRSRYFLDGNNVRRYRQPFEETLIYGYLSRYDDIVRPMAEEAGIDWKLVTAVMAEESSFNPRARSWMGAVGLMQIMPRFSPQTYEELLNPEVNISEGIRFLKKNLRRHAYLDEENQLKMALAAYNAGIGHLSEARRLTGELGGNPDKWEDVAQSFLKLMDYEYYSQSRYGFVRGTEPVQYVDKVLRRYETYQSVVAIADAHNMDSRTTPLSE